MVVGRRTLIRWGIPLLFIGLFSFLLFLYYFVGVADIITDIQRADPFYYSLAIVASMLSVILYSLTWHRLLSLLSVKTTFQRTLLFVWVGVFVDALVPAESITGEVSKVYLMSKSSNEDVGKVAASVISHRILSMTITLVGLLFGSTLFIMKYGPHGLLLDFIAIVSMGTTFSLVFVFCLLFRKRVAERIADWLLNMLDTVTRGHLKLAHLKLKTQGMLNSFYGGISVLGRSPKKFVSPIILSVFAWFFDLLTVYLVFVSLDPTFPLHFGTILIVYSLGSALQTIPIGVPGEVGVVEIITATLYTFLGIPLHIGASVTILTRVITLWLRLLLGGIAAQWVGIKILMPSVDRGKLQPLWR